MNFSKKTAGLQFWVLLLLIGTVAPIAAQKLEVRVHPDFYYTSYELGEKEGLRSNVPHGFMQDQKGYMWLIANEWVQRYNGRNFETFFTIPNHRNAHIKLIEDHNGQIWVFRCSINHFGKKIITDLGIWVIDPETGKVTDATTIWKEREFDFSLSRITAFGYTGVDSSRQVLLGLDDGAVISIGKITKTIFKLPTGQAVYITRGNDRGEYVVSWKNHLVVLDSVGKEVVRRSFESTILQTSLNCRQELYVYTREDEKINEYIWAFGEGSDPDTIKVDRYVKYGNTFIKNIQNDSFLVNINKLSILGQEERVLLECERCPNFYLDRQNNIWTTNSSGLSVLHVQSKLFKTLLSGRKIETRGILALTDSTLLVHSYKGTFIIDLQGKVLDFNAKLHDMLGLSMDKWGRIWEGRHSFFHSFIPDYKARLMAGKISNSAFLQDGNFIIEPLADEDGIWLGMRHGCRYCAWSEESILEKCVLVEHPSLNYASVNYIEKYNGRIWLATSAGMFDIDAENKQSVTHYDLLRDLNITHFSREDSLFWLTTTYNGLIRWKLGDTSYEQVKLSREEDLFATPALCAVYDDGLGYLWISSFSGLYRLRKSDLTFQRFNQTHNIAHDEFNYFSHRRLPNNQLAFGGLNGITVVDPQLVDQLNRRQQYLPLAISKVLLNTGNEEVSVGLKKEAPIILRGQRDILSMNCYLLDFRTAQPGQIIYKLEGVDTEWQLLEGQTLRLERLPFGTYNLLIRAIAHDQFSNTQQRDIVIISRKPWYLSNWTFGGLAVLLFAGGRGVMALRYRSIEKAKTQLEAEVMERTLELKASRNRILEQNKELLALNDYKSKIMAIMGHDLRGPILGLSNLGKKMKYVVDRGEIDRVQTICSESERQIDHLRILIDNLLVWSLLQDENYLYSKLAEVNLWKLAEQQIELLRANAEMKNIKVNLQGDTEVHYLSDGLILGVLIRNLISNSIRYSPEWSQVWITVYQENGTPVLIVKDEGQGMAEELLSALNTEKKLVSPYQPESKKGLGLGLWVCSSLLLPLQVHWHFSTAAGGKGLKVRLQFYGTQK